MATSTNGNDGGPAFPGNPSMDIYTNLGMSLRDYFAGRAMQGWLSNPDCANPTKEVIKALAVQSYGIADAMLKARGK